MTPRNLVGALNSMLQTRSQTLTYRATVLSAASDDGYCVVRLEQGGVRHVKCKPGAVSHGDVVMVSKPTGQHELMVVGSGQVTNQITTTTGSGSSSGGTGNVTGPATATDGNIAVFDGASGKIIKDGGTLSQFGVPYSGATGDVDLGTHILTNGGTLVKVAGASEAAASPYISFIQSRGTLASPTATQENDRIARVIGRGYGTTGYAGSARAMLYAVANQTWTDAAQGTRLELWTTPDDSTTPALVGLVGDDGRLGTVRLVAGMATGMARILVDPNGATGDYGHTISTANLTGNRVATLQDGDGTLAYLSDITGATGMAAPDSSLWMPAAKPTSSHVKDDEFDDASFDTDLWTELDESNGLTITEDVVGLKLTSTSYGEIATVTQAVPTEDYTVWTKMSIYGGTYDGWGRAGLVFQESDQDHAFYFVGPQITGANDHGDMTITSKVWSDNTTWSADGSWGDKYYPMSVWLRVRVNGGSYYVDLSLDGLSWQNVGTDTPGFTPTRFGVFLVQADQADTAVFSFFRVTTSNSINQIMYGNRVAVVNA